MDSFPAPNLEGGELQGAGVVERAVANELPIASGYEAVAAGTQPPAALLLGEAGESGLTLGGIPTARFTISDLVGRSSCELELEPYAPGCDPIVFVGLGKRAVGDSRWELVDDQIKPVRGLKDQEVIELVGVAEALAPGDELALLVYGFHPQYPGSWSRDALVPFVNLAGSVQLPVLQGELGSNM
jgi:ABC-2 type transport system ATP-binding protein